MSLCMLLSGSEMMQGESVQQKPHSGRQASATCCTHISQASSTLVLAPAPPRREGWERRVRSESRRWECISRTPLSAHKGMMLPRGFPGKILSTPLSSLTGGVGRQGVPEPSQQPENEANSAFHTRTRISPLGLSLLPRSLSIQPRPISAGDLIPRVGVSVGLPGRGWTV